MTTPSPRRRHRPRCRSRPRSRGCRAYMSIAQSASTAHCLILIFRAAGRPRPPRGSSQGTGPRPPRLRPPARHAVNQVGRACA
eukprot:scaffold21859_cov119-Isochrysis_galbana.AAC.4